MASSRLPGEARSVKSAHLALVLAVVVLSPQQAVPDETARGASPLRFEANEGQWDQPVRFVARQHDLTLVLTDDAMMFRSRGAAVTVRLVGGHSRALEGEDEIATKSNFFVGSPERWRSGVSNYGRVRAKWRDGVDVVWHGTADRIEWDLDVAAGIDAESIVFSVEGALLAIRDDGSLEMSTSAGALIQEVPRVFQDGRELEARYRVAGDQVALALGDYDPSEPVFVDPGLAYSTYLGGSGYDVPANSMAVDGAGNAYVAGFTSSPNFPTKNASQANCVDCLTPWDTEPYDAFVSKLDPTGSALVYSTYLGGSGGDHATAVAVDSAGNAYVAGWTLSTDFPTLNAYQSSCASTTKDSSCGFIAKLSPTGVVLYATYLGGSLGSEVRSIAVDASGAAFVTGDTQASDFPTVNALDATCAVCPNGNEAFVTKLAPNGSSLSYSTFLAGSERGDGIAVDSLGAAYITGAAGGDALVAKLDASGASLSYSTHVGGSASDEGDGIALDALGNAYVTGVTTSTDFPVLGANQTASGGGKDAFVTKVDSSGALVYSTYLGGSLDDVGWSIAVDGAGSAYVAGVTLSADFPIANAYMSACSVCPSFFGGFVSKLTPSGAALDYSTYLAGSGGAYAYGIAVDTAGAAYVSGGTESTDFPTVNPFQSVNKGNNLFVSKLIVDGGAAFDAGEPKDAAPEAAPPPPPPKDSGAPRDATPDAGVPSPPSGGCGCVVAPARSPHPFFALLLFALARRKRR